MLRDILHDSRRAIAYFRSNGLLPTMQKVLIKIRQKRVFRERSNSDNLYDVFRQSFDEKHEEYKGYTEYKSFDSIVKYIAFYLPQFHAIPENDEWWGEGFTEWTNVTRALPQYIGHQQPRRPANLGFYDLKNRESQLKQIELAKNYGVHGFCYHYYWFSGKKLLDAPLNALLEDNTLDFPFCINWANENWTRRWDGNESDVLLGQTYSDTDHLNFIKDVSTILQDERYIKIEGKPLLMVYRPSLIPNLDLMVQIWRDYCRDIGIGEIFLVLTHSFDTTDPRKIGFDAAVDFAPNNMPLKGVSRKVDYVNKAFSGNIYDYESAIDIAENYQQPPYIKYRSVCPSWDNEARKTGKGTALDGAKPSLYKKWLDTVNQQTIKHNDVGNRFVFINAWNEWAEGAYLEPDKRYGFSYLDATYKSLLSISRAASDRRIVLVSHDAHPHGAQYLLLHITKELSEKLKFNVDVVFLGDGELLDDFSYYANVQCVNASMDNEVSSLFTSLYAEGARSVIFNTVVTGPVSKIVKDVGFSVVSLIHEMPELISKTGHVGSAKLLSDNVDRFVFPAEVVKQGFETIVGKTLKNSVIRPQGIFRKNKVSRKQTSDQSHLQLCQKLKIPVSSYIVLNIGFGDYRKGIDLFVDIAATVHETKGDVYFVWVGHIDEVMELECRKKLHQYNLTDYVIFTGKDFDTDLYYAGSDIFALTSREDPFPSVVLEAIDAG